MFIRALKKFLTVFFVASFAVLFVVGLSRMRRQAIGSDVQPVGPTPTPEPSSNPSTTPPTGSATPVPSPDQSRKTYTGTTYRVPWGDVSVVITMQGGKLIAVDTPKYPDSPPSQYARSRLIAQALAAGTANIQGVSGATYTSLAFTRSLESALAQAKGAPQSSNTLPSTSSTPSTPVSVSIPGRSRYEDD